MKNSRYRQLALAMLALAVLAPSAAPRAHAETAQPATQQAPLNIAVIDIQQILRDSTAAKSVRAQVDKQKDAYQAQIAQQENALRDADKKLAEQRATLSADDFAKKQDQLRQQMDQLRQNSEKLKQQLEDAFNAGMGQVSQALAGVLTDIAKQRSLTLVLDKRAVPLSANSFDITADALKGLNAKLPSVTIPKPASQ
ncbi:molecular chaperone Skp [Hypericibacter adhaerens]|jgi:Skp family chaperone for outer membrane proteins|uniref:Molecular chaperone Skp n=1 Tax=Hypericibacter adhaerens TaxID=2602016 RepID=A0A5J6MZK6_9PROT|nr:OmpH family outer membrane protein [Hypericibacter adhaerens]QEX22333.1 molecular chaperone Skp [Hypericibacter adhaerens]